MRRVSVCLVTLFVCAACSLVEPETTIQVQGTVTAADDGSPIWGATVKLGKVFGRGQGTQGHTNNQGDYSLSFIETACSESFFLISASADGFLELLIPLSSPKKSAVPRSCRPSTFSLSERPRKTVQPDLLAPRPSAPSVPAAFGALLFAPSERPSTHQCLTLSCGPVYLAS